MDSYKKKVLIITYYWPPAGGGGVQRWLKFSNYLINHNWHPIIYTPLLKYYGVHDQDLESQIDKSITVIRKKIWEPYRLAGISKNKGLSHGINETLSKKSLKMKLAGWIRANVLLPDPKIFWVRPSTNFLTKYLHDNEIGHIITTGPPHSMHLIGLGIKKKLKSKIFWIADFRDPWTQFNFYQKLNPQQFAIRRMTKMESSVIRNADHITATSQSTLECIERDQLKQFTAIENGYDPVDFKNYEDKSSDQFIHLVHAGTIKSDRIPHQFLEQLNSFLTENGTKNFRLTLVGNIDQLAIDYIQTLSKVNLVTEFVGYVDHTALINKYYSSASAFLLLVNDSLSSKANIPAKLFEYLYTEKPIVAIGKCDDDAIALVRDLDGYCIEYDGEHNMEEIIHYLRHGRTKINERYNRYSLTKRLVEILESSQLS